MESERSQTMTNAWMVRAGRGGYVIEDFEKKGCVAVGWEEMGDIPSERWYPES